MDATNWNDVWTEFIGPVGTTTTNLDNALSVAAMELSQVGHPTDDLGTLLHYVLFQASGAVAGIYLSDITDIPAARSSLSLSLDRYSNGTLQGRDATGEFGAGWLWAAAVTIWPPFADCQVKAASREIPVVVVDPVR